MPRGNTGLRAPRLPPAAAAAMLGSRGDGNRPAAMAAATAGPAAWPASSPARRRPSRARKPRPGKEAEPGGRLGRRPGSVCVLGGRCAGRRPFRHRRRGRAGGERRGNETASQRRDLGRSSRPPPYVTSAPPGRAGAGLEPPLPPEWRRRPGWGNRVLRSAAAPVPVVEAAETAARRLFGAERGLAKALARGQGRQRAAVASRRRPQHNPGQRRPAALRPSPVGGMCDGAEPVSCSGGVTERACPRGWCGRVRLESGGVKCESRLP